MHSVHAQDLRGRARKLFGEEARIVPYNKRRLLAPATDVFGNGSHCEPHVCKGKLVGDNRAPAGGAEADRMGGHNLPSLMTLRRGIVARPGHPPEVSKK